MATKIDISKFIPIAQENEKKYGVPASITLAQLILESTSSTGEGLSMLATNAKNLFGVKAGSKWTGSTYLIPTKEEVNGKLVTVMGKFRQYGSYEESIEDHAKLLTGDRYSVFTKSATTVEQFAQAIKNGGYATDSKYVSKLVSVIKDNNLMQYDKSGMMLGEGSSDMSNIGVKPDPNNPDQYKDNIAKAKTKTQGVYVGVVVAIIIIVILFLIVQGLNIKVPTPVGNVNIGGSE
jgi:flagellum-specific peptidoglycan hydrolase FlgJ